MKWCGSLSLALLVASILPTSGSPQARPETQHRSVEVNGISMAYRVVGEGEPMILLHGLTQTGAGWDTILQEFALHFRVVVPDLRGHGHSTNPSGLFTHRQVALDVFALLDSLGIESFKAMGASTGANSLLHMATRQPQRVEAMVLIAGTTYFPDQAREILRSFPDSVPQAFLENLVRSHPRGLAQARELLGYLRAFSDNYDDMNLTPDLLSTITAETLIVYGDRDEFFPVSIALEQYQAIEESYLWVVPNGAHGAPLGFERGRLRLTETVLEFLSGEWH